MRMRNAMVREVAEKRNPMVLKKVDGFSIQVGCAPAFDSPKLVLHYKGNTTCLHISNDVAEALKAYGIPYQG